MICDQKNHTYGNGVVSLIIILDAPIHIYMFEAHNGVVENELML